MLSQSFIIFTLYTIVQTKLPNYIVPLYPILSLFVARFLEIALTKFSLFTFPGLSAAVIGAVAIAQPETLWTFVAVGLILSFLILATRRKFVYSRVAVFVILFLFAVGIKTLRHFYGHQETSLAKISTIARRTNDKQVPLIIFPGGKIDNLPVALFYSERRFIVGDPTKQQTSIEGNPAIQVITDEMNLAKLERLYEISIIAEMNSIIYADAKPLNIDAK